MANEKRLIDANALFDELIKRQYSEQTMGIVASYYPQMRAIVANTPTVDAVEVVRCKECRWARKKDHREPTDTPGELICQCFKHYHIPAPWGARMAVSENDFCSYGERKDNG